MLLPPEINEYFAKVDHPRFPILEIPQVFRDSRGAIFNIADGQLSDVAIIDSNANSIRANHYHKEDWHLSYILSGAAEYRFKSIDLLSGEPWNSITIGEGDLIFTPSNHWHCFEFLEPTTMVVVSRISRLVNIYESDTIRSNQQP